MRSKPTVATTIDQVLADEANKALIKGGKVLSISGLIAAAMIAATTLAGLTQGIELACAASFVAGAIGALACWLARAGRVKGAVVYLLFLPFVSLPTGLFLASHFLLPAGAATYLTGPFSLLYLVLIAATAFMFDWRLPIVSSLVAAGGYLFCFWLAAPHLAEIEAPDPAQLQDLRAFPLFFFRAFIMVLCGGLVAALTGRVRGHIERVREEEQKQERVTRLFGEFVSPEVAQRLLSATSVEAGERREVAVLFSDLRGFTTFSERLEPEEVVRRLNAYFDAMVECLRAHGGVVDKFIGDAVMAVFGGVLPLERPCDAAIEAARDMRARLAELNARWRTEGLSPLENGVGIHFGTVLQGTIGSHDRKDFTVIGDAVNTASRIEGISKDYPQRVIVTRQVYERLSEPLRALCVPHGMAHVKGKADELEVYGVPDPAPAVAQAERRSA
jgi:class 3 adenylate cyclase